MKRLGLAAVVFVVAACGSGDPGGPVDNGGPTPAPTAAAQPRVQNTTWQLTGVGDTVVPETGEGSAKIFFGLMDAFNGISVTGPCDKLSGKYHTDGFDFKTIELAATTTNTCTAEITAAQQAFIDAMLGATNLAISGDGVLTITGSAAITFKPFVR